MSKQTSVEWLQECLSIHITDDQKMQFEGLFQQAKAMEKEQIVISFNEGQQHPYNDWSAEQGKQYYNETYKGGQMDNIDKFIIALKDLIIEYKGNNPNYIANEISNRISCYKMSDRESFDYEQTGVLYHFYTMLDVLNNIDKK